MKYFFFIFTIGFLFYPIHSQSPAFLQTGESWADSILNQMDQDEIIGQLFMDAAYSNKGKAHEREIEKLINENKIGGLIFFQGGPVRQALLTNRYQNLSKVPLWIGMDAEWGLAMRLDSTPIFARQMLLGAMKDTEQVYRMGKEIARQCKRLGVHINFAPVVDVNNNPDNPVINNRSFGENKERVFQMGLAYMNGLESERVFANAKHFPGHGDTDIDSHHDLPVVNFDKDRLMNMELYPFKKLIENNLSSVMVAHMSLPKIDTIDNLPSTLSSKLIKGILKEELGFKGLVFTDALNMKGVAKHFSVGEADLKALQAGNDILLFPQNVPLAVQKIKEAIKNGALDFEQVKSSAKKILQAKFWVGLNNFNTIELNHLYEDLNTVESEMINRAQAEQSLVVLENKENALFIEDVKQGRIACLVIGDTLNNHFQQNLSRFAFVDLFQVGKYPSEEEINTILNQIENHSHLIIGLHGTYNNPKKLFGVSKETVLSLSEISLRYKGKSIFTVFGSPYILNIINGRKFEGLIVAHQDTKYTQKAAAELIMGAVFPSGKLPVSVQNYHEGEGIKWDKITRMKNVLPQELGANRVFIKKIDSIVTDGIRSGAYPGCQLVIAKDGQVFYNKSFGYHTYDSTKQVLNDDLYDIASITKIAASTVSLMKLQSEGLLHIDSTLQYFLPERVDSTPYANLTLREMLAHQAGLVSWIPFYYKTLEQGKPSSQLYKLEKEGPFNVKVTDDLFIHEAYRDTIFQRIMSTSLKRKKYKYSDIGYYFIKEIIEKVTNDKMENYVEKHFYSPLGLKNIGYRPKDKHELSRIIPTEDDKSFRMQLIHGDVHDPGAAMLGGVGGHAGVFSSAEDLSVLMQMILNEGSYGGVEFIRPEVVREFTKKQYHNNRRGAGFDKPVTTLDGGPTCDKVSLDSYGHSGFTGTIVWADPKYGINYVFLSNRVYPNAENWKLVKMDIRTKIQKAIYETFE